MKLPMSKAIRLAFAVAAALAGCVCSAEHEAPRSRASIVLIFMDDMGWSDVGFLGGTAADTPHMDSIARDGMTFTNAYVTAPVCTPSRAGLMAGQYGSRHGIFAVSPEPNMRESWEAYIKAQTTRKLLGIMNRKRVPDNVMNLPAAMKAAGYVTGCVGKWHHQPSPEESGFDEVMRGGRRSRDDPKQIGRITDWAVEFVTRHRDRPFFLYVSHHAPHVGVEAKPETIAKYESRRQERGGDYDPAYSAMIDDADAGIGRLLRSIDEAGLRERTMVVLFSDNGGFTRKTSNAPLRKGKGTLYEGGIRVPLAIRWPGRVDPGSSTDTPVVATDLLPTFLEAAGAGSVKPPQPLDGVSLMPVLTGGELPERSLFWHFPLYSSYSGPCGAMRRGKWKLIEFFEDNRVELYDLATDIGEIQDLSRERREVASRLRAELAAWRADIGTEMPKLNTRLK